MSTASWTKAATGRSRPRTTVAPDTGRPDGSDAAGGHYGGGNSNGGGSSNHDTDSLPEEVAYLLDKDSPTSFPTTPFSRARIMYRSAERTDTVRFSRVGVLYRPARQDAPFAH